MGRDPNYWPPWRWRLAELADGLAAWLDSWWHRRVYRLHLDPGRRPRLASAGTVPLTTWLRHPRDGWQSYRRHVDREALAALRAGRRARRRGGPPDGPPADPPPPLRAVE